MKLNVLVALLATGQAVQVVDQNKNTQKAQLSSKNLIQSRVKANNKALIAIDEALKNNLNKNNKLVEVSEDCPPVPSVCAIGYHPDSDGNCVSDVSVSH